MILNIHYTTGLNLVNNSYVSLLINLVDFSPCRGSFCSWSGTGHDRCISTSPVSLRSSYLANNLYPGTNRFHCFSIFWRRASKIFYWTKGVISTFSWGVGKFFFHFPMPPDYWKFEKNFICSNLTLFIVPFFLSFFLSFFSFFPLFSLFSSFFSFFLFPWGSDGPPAPSNDASVLNYCFLKFF